MVPPWAGRTVGLLQSPASAGARAVPWHVLCQPTTCKSKVLRKKRGTPWRGPGGGGRKKLPARTEVCRAAFWRPRMRFTNEWAEPGSGLRRRPARGPEGMGRPEGTELLLLLRIELILDPNEQGEVHLLHLLLDGRHLAQLGEHRRLVHVVGGQELAERLGFRVEPPLKVDQLLLRLVHRLLDGVHLGRPEPDLLLVLHHELRRKDLLQERGRAGRRTRLHHSRATHRIGR